MTAKRLIVESAVKDELRNGEDITVSSAALDWVNAQTVAAVESCRKTGRRTPGGRLMAPESGSDRSVVIRQPEQAEAADGRSPPERVCWRTKEWRAMTPEQKNERLQMLYAQAPAINDDAIALLTEFGDAWIFGGLRDLLGDDHPLAKIFARSSIVIADAKGLEPR